MPNCIHIHYIHICKIESIYLHTADDLTLPPETEESDIVDIDGFWAGLRKDKLVSGLLKGKLNAIIYSPKI